MTGYGDASGEVDGIVLNLELRSLNNRYFKGMLRLPEELASLEAQLEAELRRRIARGSVTLSIRMRRDESQQAGRVNLAALADYARQLHDARAHVARQTAGDALAPLNLADLLELPGVLEIADDLEQLIAAVQPVVMRLLDQAYAKFLAMRRREGDALIEDLTRHRRQIAEHMEIVRARAPHVAEEYHDRLRVRVEELLARAQLKVDQVDLLRETAIYAERCDISEEVSRLGAHLEHFDQVLTASGTDPSGRTIEFLAQEMLREANTIASKSNDAAISRATVAMKSAIDRIKEQAQNVE